MATSPASLDYEDAHAVHAVAESYELQRLLMTGVLMIYAYVYARVRIHNWHMGTSARLHSVFGELARAGCCPGSVGAAVRSSQFWSGGGQTKRILLAHAHTDADSDV